MAKRWKNPEVVPVRLTLHKGMNYMQAASAIDDNEMIIAENVMYDVNTDKLTVRPGLNCISATALTTPIRALYEYVKDSTHQYIMAVANDKLYYLSTDTMTEVGTLSSATVIPSFVTFNSKLLVADGSTNIMSWDGTTYAAVSTGSPKASALGIIKNRVVANHDDEADSVYMSALQDETTWTGGTSLALKAGYGDGMKVNGFATLGDDLIVSKVGRYTTSNTKRLYRVNTSDTTAANWSVTFLSGINAFSSSPCAVSAFNNIFFADTNGFKSIKGVQEYGDIAIDQTGRKVNSIFENYTAKHVKYLPAFNCIGFIVSGRTYLYYDHNQAFTCLKFNNGEMHSLCEASGSVYLGGRNGYLYKLDPDRSTDQTDPDTTSAYTSEIITKAFTTPGEVLLKRIKLLIKPISEATVRVWSYKPNLSQVQLKEITMGSADDYLYDEDDPTEDTLYLRKSQYLYDSGSSPDFVQIRSVARGEELSVKIQTTTGRVSYESLSIDLAQVK